MSQTAQVCECPTNEIGDVRCHVCGEYVNVRCWNCKTPRGGGPCPNPAARPKRHDCETCADCIHDGRKCCGCYDGACCKENDQRPPRCVLCGAQAFYDAPAGRYVHEDPAVSLAVDHAARVVTSPAEESVDA